MSEEKSFEQIIDDSNLEFNMLSNHDEYMNKFHTQFNKIFDKVDNDTLQEPSSVERSCSMEVEDGNVVKIEICEKREYNFDDDDLSDEFDDVIIDEENILIYANDPTERYPEGKYVSPHIAQQWDEEREKIKQERIENKPKEDITK